MRESDRRPRRSWTAKVHVRTVIAVVAELVAARCRRYRAYTIPAAAGKRRNKVAAPRKPSNEYALLIDTVLCLDIFNHMIEESHIVPVTAIVPAYPKILKSRAIWKNEDARCCGPDTSCKPSRMALA
jgi:hypothetical protein